MGQYKIPFTCLNCNHQFMSAYSPGASVKQCTSCRSTELISQVTLDNIVKGVEQIYYSSSQTIPVWDLFWVASEQYPMLFPKKRYALSSTKNLYRIVYNILISKGVLKK